MFTKVLVVSGTATLALAAAHTGAQPGTPYVEEMTPSPEESEITSLVAGEGGRLIAAGETLYRRIGGGWQLPLFLEKGGPGAQWTQIPSPDFGMAPGQYHRMHRVVELPGGDLLALGHYNPDPLSGRFRAIIMHYRRATEQWTLNELPDPAPEVSSRLNDAAVDPLDPDRVLIVGTTLDGAGCNLNRALVVEYRPSTGAYRALPISGIGELRSIVALDDGTSLVFGIESDICAFTARPVVFRIEGERAIPIPEPPLGNDFLQRRMQKAVALPSGDVLVVGYSSPNDLGGFKPMAHVLDPRTLSWRVLTPPNPPEFLYSQFWDVAVGPDGRAHAVGRYRWTFESRFHFGPLIQSFDGESWRLEEVPPYLTAREYTRANTQLWGVAVLGDGTVYTGGRIYRLGTPRESRTILLRQDAGGCYADCDGSGALDFFDFLCFQNSFLAGDPYADCDMNGTLDFFDFLCFQNEFLAGCP